LVFLDGFVSLDFPLRLEIKVGVAADAVDQLLLFLERVRGDEVDLRILVPCAGGCGSRF